MNDRDQAEVMSQQEPETMTEPTAERPAPIMDMDVFAQLRDVVKNHYLWQCDSEDEPTRAVIKDITNEIHHDPHFRLVGEIEVNASVFEITLWLEESMAFSLASVDMMTLDALHIDFSRCAILARELTRYGLEYHLVTFGDGRAQEFHINIIGPRMQQIRDLGTLVAPADNAFSA